MIVPNETADLRKKLTNWAALSDISVLDSLFQDRNIKLTGKKAYRSKMRFSVGFLFLWIFTGFVVGIIISAEKRPSVGAVPWLIFPLGYVVYYFVKHRDRTVWGKVING